MNIKMGQVVKDKITGFSGTVTGIAEYITGCTQISIQPSIKADGDFVEGRWIDSDRLEIVNAKPIEHKVSIAGGPAGSAPMR